MKLFVAFSIPLLLLYHSSSSQSFSHEYGQVTAADFEYEFPKDPDAEAVILYDIGDSRFVREENSFDVTFKRRKKIKINSEAGLEWAEVQILVYKENHVSEKITELTAATYNLENGIIKTTQLNKDNIFEERLNENWYVKKFAMPNVKPGSVIEISYTLQSPFKFNLQDWEFQSTIPTAYSKYEVRMIPFYEYTFLLQGSSKFDEREAYQDRGLERQFSSVKFQDYVYIFGMKEVPAFKDIEFITSKNDYLIKIDFQLAVVHSLSGGDIEVMSTWPKLVKELSKHFEFGKFVDKSEKQFGKEVESKLYTDLQGLERVKFGVNYVKSNYQWDGFYGKYSSKDFKEFEREKSGNSGGINLYLTGVLRALGFEAYPVILSTRDHGKVHTDYPFAKFFNYTIVAVKFQNQIFLTDATENLNSPYRIPIKCINDMGLIINEDEAQWISLNPMFLSTTQKVIYLKVSDEGVLNIDFTLHANEYDGLYYRKKYSDDNERLKEHVADKNIELLSDIVVENLQESDKPYKYSFKGFQPIENVSDKIFISPFLKEPVEENPFTQESREYPIDLIYPTSRIFSSTIEIPEGYKVDSKPEPLKISNSLADINLSCNTFGKNLLKIEGRYTFKRGVYQAEDYKKLAFYYKEIIRAFNQKVVLSELK